MTLVQSNTADRYPRVPIESLCQRVTSGGTPSRAVEKYWTNGTIPWFKTGELNDGYLIGAEEFITADALEESAAKMFPANTVLMAMYGDGRTITTLGILREAATTNQACCAMIADPQVSDHRFLFYALMHHRHELLKLVVAGAQRNLSTGIIRKFPITTPALPTQRRIAEILSAYDDLIENNQRRMNLLEESARLLYEEWFVRLRFPGHDHTKIIDGIPEGWNKTSIDAVTSFLGRGISPAYDEAGKSMVINQKCIRDRRLDLTPARRQSKEFKSDRQIQVGDVLVNSTGEGTLGRVSQVFVPIPDCTVDSHVTIVRPMPEISRFVFGQMMMSLDSVFPTMGRGATNQKELGRDQIGEMTFVLPSSKVSREFDTFAEPIYLNVYRLQEKNQKLRAARDLLLPRLMNGGIEV